MRGSNDPLAVIARLETATNAHDLAALTACFADDYVNATPVHPAQGFTGSAQVERNWATLFGAMPDLRSQLLATSVDGATVWSEWEMSGTRPDGSAHLMRGSDHLHRGGRRHRRPRGSISSRSPPPAPASTTRSRVRRTPPIAAHDHDPRRRRERNARPRARRDLIDRGEQVRALTRDSSRIHAPGARSSSRTSAIPPPSKMR